MYFGRRGQQGEGWTPHLNTVVPENGVIFHELHTIDGGDVPSSSFHEALHAKAAERGAVVLPAGFYGERKNASAPTFTPDELLLLMPKSVKHLTGDTLKKYQKLQSIREMRAAVGSLAWLAAHTNVQAEYVAKPAVLWGRTHSASLPDMYQRLGVHSVEVHYLDAPLRYTYLQPHGLHWSEHDIQHAFQHAYTQALNYILPAGQISDA